MCDAHAGLVAGAQAASAREEEDRRFVRAATETARQTRGRGNHPLGAMPVDGQGRITLQAENTHVGFRRPKSRRFQPLAERPNDTSLTLTGGRGSHRFAARVGIIIAREHSKGADERLVAVLTIWRGCIYSPINTNL